MNKILIILLLTISTITVAQDFENSNWNTSKEQVLIDNSDALWLDAYSAEINMISEFITYESTLKDLSCYITYYFVENTLQMGTYIFSDTHYEYDTYLDDYKKLQKHLRKTFGKPSNKGSVWNNGCIQGKPNKADMIAMGHVSHYAEYNDGKVYLEIVGSNGTIAITLMYISPGFDELVDDILNNRHVKYY